MTTNPLKVWDFTYFLLKDDNMETVENMKDLLKSLCIDWAFQVEKGEKSGRVHFQGRMRLKTKKRLNTLVNNFKDFRGIHFSPTTKENRDNDFYVLKDETRIGGPWKSTDPWEPATLLKEHQLFQWQKDLCSIAAKEIATYDNRHINILHNLSGNIGKSSLFTFLEIRYNALSLAILDSCEDMLQMAYGKLSSLELRDNIIILVDIPKATAKYMMQRICRVVETLKDGKAYDKRYNWKEWRFNPPSIWISTNKKMNKDWLSADRWQYWTVLEDALIRTNEKGEPIVPMLENTEG
jgi:hypothetical protein